jgi:flagellar biosynthetic protein FlhB
MSEEDEGQEKVFDPTPRKLEEARERGDVPRSMDANAAAGYLGLLVAIGVFGAASARAFGEAVRPFLGSVDHLEGRLLGPGGLELGAVLAGKAFLATSPLFLLPMLAVVASLMAQRAFAVSGDKLASKLDRISPLAQFKQKFGPTGLMEFLKSAVKMVLISAGVWWWATANIDHLVGLAAAPARGLPRYLGESLVSLLVVVTAIAVAIAGVDLLWQHYDHARKLRMSLEDMKKESKETDGDPHMRQQRRRRAEEIAKNRMLLDVPKSDVVIVNPTHYAVALKWSRKPRAAPVCVAKGVDEVAAAIRAKAAEAGVPIHRDAPTARSIHALVDIGREIHPDHYLAAAAAIRFASEMRRKAAERGR